jgi:hypothetical protein
MSDADLQITETQSPWEKFSCSEECWIIVERLQEALWDQLKQLTYSVINTDQWEKLTVLSWGNEVLSANISIIRTAVWDVKYWNPIPFYVDQMKQSGLGRRQLSSSEQGSIVAEEIMNWIEL